MTVLRGPADAEQYRIKVGRYNDRWYYDSLPSCPIADKTDWQGPAWSIVKGASGKDWSYTANKRNGHTSPKELFRIAGLDDPDERTKAYNGINKKGLKQAQGRGQIVHLWAEDLLAGRGPRIITDPILFSLKLPRAALDEATEYVEALAAFFDHYQPEVIAAEYVALHRDLNGYGYGCTPDVIARIEGQTVGIDWKTRGIDSDHGAYPEEAAQIAAGARAEYMIITGPDGAPMRAQLPDIDCGIVVSIKPDGCRVYPTDIDLGFAHVEAMHAFWVARLSEKTAIGKPWPPTPVAMSQEEILGIEGHEQQEDLWTTSNTPSNTSTGSSAKSTAPSTGSTTPPNNSSTPPNNSSKPSPNSATAPPDDLWTTTASPGTNTPTSSTTSTTPTSTPTHTTASTTTPTTETASSTPSSSKNPPTDDLTYTSHLLATAMADWDAGLIEELKAWWPKDTPTPAKVRAGKAIWTEQQLADIQQLCDWSDSPFWNVAIPQRRHTA